MAKQEPPNKRSKKPATPEGNELPHKRGLRKNPKMSNDTDHPGAIKKPVQLASYTLMGFQQGLGRDTVGQGVGSLGHGGPQKSSVGSSKSTQSPSLSLYKSNKSRDVTEGKTSGSSKDTEKHLELNTSSGKSNGVAALSLNTGKNPSQANVRHSLSSPNGQKKPQGSVSGLQRIPHAKAVGFGPSKNNNSSQGSGFQPLNLQNKPAQNSTTSENEATLLSGTKIAPKPARKANAPQNQDCNPNTSPESPCRLEAGKNYSEANKTKEAAEIRSTHNQGRLEKSSVHTFPQQEKFAYKTGRKMNDMSTGEDETSSDSDQDSTCSGKDSSMNQTQDWKPTRDLIEHVFVTDVTANLVTVTVKESPTSMGFFSVRNY